MKFLLPLIFAQAKITLSKAPRAASNGFLALRYSLLATVLALGASAQTLPTPSATAITKNNTTSNLTGGYNTGPNTITVNAGGSIVTSGTGSISGNVTASSVALGNITGAGTGVLSALANATNSSGGVLTYGSTLASKGITSGAALDSFGAAQSGTAQNVTTSGTPTFASVNGITGIATAAQARDVQAARSDLVPSVASMQAAIAPLRNGLAPRQGLVFDGTAGATVNVAAFGTGDFSVGIFASWPVVNTQYRALVGHTSNSGNFFIGHDTDGNFIVTKTDGGTPLNSGFIGVTGKFYFLGYTRSGTTGTFYVNGAAVATVTDNQDYTTGLNEFGGNAGGLNNIWAATIAGAAIYNRALSAAEVLALYESGAPAAADYNNASNTAAYSSDFSSSSGWSLDPGTTISGGKLNLGDTAGAYAPSTSTAIVVGRKYRLTITIDSITAGAVKYYNGSAFVSFATTAGTYTVEFTCLASYAQLVIRCDGGSVVADNLSFYNLGLLCAPEANAPGNGNQWHDMSRTVGPFADITLPTTGVTWALPDNRPNYVRGTLTWSGTHEPKSLLGQVAFPAMAVFDFATVKSTAGTSGSGVTLGTTNSATRLAPATPLTTAKQFITPANRLPAGTAAGDLDVVVDPDTANFTGSLDVELHYSLSAGTP